MRTAFGRTTAAIFAIGILAALVEAVAYTHGFRVFVPITWAIIEGSLAAPIVTLAMGGLLGHFSLPRIPGWRRWAVLAGLLPSTVLAYTFYVPCAAALAGFIAGGLFFVAEDRRRVATKAAQATDAVAAKVLEARAFADVALGATVPAIPHDLNSLRCWCAPRLVRGVVIHNRAQ